MFDFIHFRGVNMAASKPSKELASFAGTCRNGFTFLVASFGAALSTPQMAHADSFDAWQKQTTDKGCYAYTYDESAEGMEADGEPIGFVWSGNCTPDAPISGQGTQYVQEKYDSNNIRRMFTRTGRMVNGYWNGPVEVRYFDVDANGNWNANTPLTGDSAPSVVNYQMGCSQYVRVNPSDRYACAAGKVVEPIIIPPVSPAYYAIPGRPSTIAGSRATNSAGPTANSAPPGVGRSVAESRGAPGGVSISGPDTTGVATVKSPKIAETPILSEPKAEAIGSGLSAPKNIGDFTPVSDCVSIEQSRSHPFVNKCQFKVTYTYCVLSPKKGAWSEAFRCEDQHFGTDAIGANYFNGAHNTGGLTTYWFACRFPQLPIAKYERGRGAVGLCK
jgi:hypothetical protein